jgi:hypothetical protein
MAEDHTIAVWCSSGLIPKIVSDQIQENLPEGCSTFILDIDRSIGLIEQEKARGPQYDFAVLVITANLVRNKNFPILADHLIKNYHVIRRLYPIGVDGVTAKDYEKICPELAKIKLLPLDTNDPKDIDKCRRIMRHTIESLIPKPPPSVKPLDVFTELFGLNNLRINSKPPPLPTPPSLPLVTPVASPPKLLSSAIARPTTPEPKKEPESCVICMNSSREVVFLDCFHIACCLSCAGKITNNSCPICQQTFRSFHKVYYA